MHRALRRLLPELVPLARPPRGVQSARLAQRGGGATFASSAPANEAAATAARPGAPRGGAVLRSYDYRVLGHGYNARVTLLNALNARQDAWARALSEVLSDALSRGDSRVAWCFSSPITPHEAAYLAEAERADEEAARLQRHPWQRLVRRVRMALRLVWLLIIFTPVAVTAPLSWTRGALRQYWLRLFRRTLERGGPAFIKWGQWAATRRDLFPPDLAAQLELLHSQAPAHSARVTERAIEAAFGFGVADLFYSFEDAPVASGSIGQIHRAQLSETGARLTGIDEGTTVAVKVRHPGVSEVIERDFALMSVAARLLGALPPLRHLRLEESLRQFAAPLREQVDLGREAMHLHAFNYNFRRMREVSFPVPLYPLVTPAVLVETFEPGRHIGEYVERGAGAPFNSALAIIGARTMLRMMLVDSLIHADLHPGNILVRLETPGGRLGRPLVEAARAFFKRAGAALGVDLTPPVDWMRRPHMVLLDAGMAMTLSRDDHVNMCGLFEAFSRMDGEGVAEWVLKFSGPEQSCPDPEAFRRDLGARMEEARSSKLFVQGSEANGAEELAAVLDMCREHQVSLPGHICATVVTTLVLEGWSHDLDPAHSTLSEVQRLLAASKGGILALLTTVADLETLERVPTFDDPLATNRFDVARLMSGRA